MENEETEYELVDTKGLAACMAESDWKIQTNNILTDDLWETVKGKKQIRSKWATQYWALYEVYWKLIREHVKE